MSACKQCGSTKERYGGCMRCRRCYLVRQRERQRSPEYLEYKRDYNYWNRTQINGRAQVRYAARRERDLIAAGLLDPTPTPYSPGFEKWLNDDQNGGGQ
jgi:hypothetical protein